MPLAYAIKHRQGRVIYVMRVVDNAEDASLACYASE